MSAVTSERHGPVAVLRMNNPPVNGLGAPLRSGLADAIAGLDPAVEAIVLIGEGRMYSAGADIREFNSTPPPGTPDLNQVIAALEGSERPVVSAIHGVAAGGGLELALGTHYRVAAPGSRVGLPEVTLGIVPGAGGTQRLPRLIGTEAALELIVSGRLIGADQARELGIIDEVADGDLLEASVAAARRLAADGTVRRVRDCDDALAAARATPELFETFRAGMARSARGRNAPYACVDCVEAAVNRPFDEGLRFERETFVSLVAAPESRSLRHAFFAERECGRIPDLPRETRGRTIGTAAVVGCGTMGGGIAMNFANAGIPVTVVETERAALDAGLERVRNTYATTVSRGRLAADEMERRMSLITGSTELADVGSADIVIEAVFEEMELKKEVFRALDGVCRSGAILATNTSTLDVDEIAAVTGRPEDVIGTHFFSPANVMRLLENVRGVRSSHETIATVMDMARTIGKVGVLVGVCDGFVGNRMLHQYGREAGFLIEEGALPQQVDRVIYDFGFPMGPFAMGDLAGLDVGWRIRQRKRAERPSNMRYSDVADRICEQGRFGQKTGAGWYRYETGSRVPVPDPDIERLIVAASQQAGIERRDIPDGEILERCMYPLVNEAAKILEEGLAIRPSDIDVIWIHGYGFPRWRGGPMFWADSVGLDRILEAMQRWHREHGEWMRPAPLLERLVREGRGFASLGA
ncbi:MAG: 3-hydroxyacyl-CoA dehydrogenase NAD-binding domain-containing protein [Alphaproteobacteria bacterium]|nr:3-hydroxyacyl-CoA dehydrogenase NAD-binding domain-containing protein [Alphaproteobacteria bacterium]